MHKWTWRRLKLSYYTISLKILIFEIHFILIILTFVNLYNTDSNVWVCGVFYYKYFFDFDLKNKFFKQCKSDAMLQSWCGEFVKLCSPKRCLNWHQNMSAWNIALSRSLSPIGQTSTSCDGRIIVRPSWNNPVIPGTRYCWLAFFGRR